MNLLSKYFSSLKSNSKTSRLLRIFFLTGASSLIIGISTPAISCDVNDPFPNSIYQNLNHGLYWYGGDACANEKAIPGQSNPYFNKNNKTMIYIHGWQQNSVKNTSRETFRRTTGSHGNVREFADYWRNRGWNVGILYWNQFADEGNVEHAEAKIWTTNGPRQMKWKKYTGNNKSTQVDTGINKTAAQLLYQHYKDNMKGYKGNDIRILGHSLGNQMALAVADKIRDGVNRGKINSKLKPKRVALLDPFYSNGSKSYLGGKWPGELAREAAFRLMDSGIKIEAYRSSPVTSTVFIGDENKPLMRKVAFTELKPWEFGAWDLVGKHMAAVSWYLWSMDKSQISIKNSSDKAASAKSSNSRINALMNSSKKLVHDLGAYTTDPGDDRMKYANR